MAWIKAKWDGKCKECDCLITAGEKIWYNGKVYCIDCGEELDVDGTP